MTSAAPVRIELPRPHEAQRQVMEEARRFNVIACGRRWGKTQMGIELVTHPALSGYPVSWYVPTYKDAAEVWRQLKRLLRHAIASKSETEKRIELVTRGSIDVWTLQDPDSSRGRKNARVVIDEAAKVPKLEEAWTETIRPTLTDYRGDAWFLSTPKGRNYFYRLYQMGMGDARGWRSWRMPTSANPFINPDEVKEAQSQLPQSAFEQEYMAAFTDDAGAVFRNVRACIDKALNDTQPVTGRHYSAGLDWAQQNDFTVIAVVDDAGALVALDRFNQVAWEVQYGRVKAMTERWAIARGLAELNSIGGPNLEQLQQQGLNQWRGFMTTNDTKAQVIQALALAFERREIRIPDDPALVAELEAFEMNRLPSGKWKYGAPDGMHDDTVIALALAWEAKQSGGISFAFV